MYILYDLKVLVIPSFGKISLVEFNYLFSLKDVTNIQTHFQTQ